MTTALSGQQDRAEEHEQHDVGGGHDERHRPRRVRAYHARKSRSKAVWPVTSTRASPGGCVARMCCTRLRASSLLAGNAVCTTSSAMCRPMVWASAPWIAGGPVGAHDRQHLVLAQREGRIQVDEALDAQDSRLLGEPAAQVVELRDLRRRQRRARAEVENHQDARGLLPGELLSDELLAPA